jgi:hypothetical protein
MQCILCKIYFWKVFHKYYNLICIFICIPIYTKKFILVKSGCYINHLLHRHLVFFLNARLLLGSGDLSTLFPTGSKTFTILPNHIASSREGSSLLSLPLSFSPSGPDVILTLHAAASLLFPSALPPPRCLL